MRYPPCSRPRRRKPCGLSNAEEHFPCHPIPHPPTIATIGVDLAKNTFHLVGLDRRGAIVLQLKLSRGGLPRTVAYRRVDGRHSCHKTQLVGRR